MPAKAGTPAPTPALAVVKLDQVARLPGPFLCTHRERMRILVVEDEPELLRVTAQALREEGYAVDEAADGDDGFFKASSWEYDAIVLDLMLPGRSGWQVLAELRRQRK